MKSFSKNLLLFIIVLAFLSVCQKNKSSFNNEVWNQKEMILKNIISPTFPEKIFNIVDFGAVTDGKTDSRKSINDAIKTCSENGSGTVIIPDGVFYVNGSIYLQLQTAEEAFDSVLTSEVASFANRDSIDARIVYETLTGTDQYGDSWEGDKKGIIDSQDDIGVYPELISVEPPLDTDHDSMPNYWEDINGSDYMNPEDNKVIGDDSYTMFGTYLYQLVDEANFVEIYSLFELIGNYPNPLNLTTIINYYVPKFGSVEINIYDIKCSLVEKLLDKGRVS